MSRQLFDDDDDDDDDDKDNDDDDDENDDDDDDDDDECARSRKCRLKEGGDGIIQVVYQSIWFLSFLFLFVFYSSFYCWGFLVFLENA